MDQTETTIEKSGGDNMRQLKAMGMADDDEEEEDDDGKEFQFDGDAPAMQQ